MTRRSKNHYGGKMEIRPDPPEVFHVSRSGFLWNTAAKNPFFWHQHPNGGGWVENSAHVDQTVFIGPAARVFGDAKVYDKVRICDAAKVYSHAEVFDRATLRDNVQVCGDAKVCGDANVRGDIIICDGWVV